MVKRRVEVEQVESVNEIVEISDYAQRQLIEQKKKELPKYIKKRKKQFVKELEQYGISQQDEEGNIVIVDKTLPLVEVSEHCFSPFIQTNGATIQYSAEELSIIFDYYKQVVSEMNKKQIFPPTKEQFCSLCNFSTSTFNNLKVRGDEQTRELLLKIEDYICNYLSIGGLTRKVSEVTAIFAQKVMGRKEAGEQALPPQNNTLIIGDEAFLEWCNKYGVNNK